MRICCPSCHRTLREADLAPARGWGKCGRCEELFRLRDTIPGCVTMNLAAPVAGQSNEWPFNALADVRRDGERLEIYYRPGAQPAQTWIAIAGAIVFFCGTTLIEYPFLENGPHEIVLLIPGLLISLALLGVAFWCARATLLVTIDTQELVVEHRCGPWQRVRRYDRHQVSQARPWEPNTEKADSDSRPKEGVEIICDGGPVRLRCVDRVERDWLTDEINNFLNASPRADRSPGPTAE